MSTPPFRSEVAPVLTAVVAAAAALALVWPSPSAAQDKPPDAADYLNKMAEAEDATYRARQLVVYFGSPQSAALVDIRSSEDGHFVRAESGSVVTRLWKRPGMGVVTDGDVSITDAAPPFVPLRPDAVMAKYEIEVDPPQRLLGVEVTPLTLQRRSDRRTVERLWVHEGSGVVYRRELYGADGQLVGMSTVLEMRWGDAGPAAEPFEPPPQAASRVEVSVSGSAPRALPDGYWLLREYRIRTRGQLADHWLYSDGLHALSVFRTPGGMRAPKRFLPADLGGARGWAGPGPGTWAWEGDGSSWVIVAEEPALDPERLTSQFPKGGPSVWARLGSVWSRAFRAVASLFG